MARTGEFSFGMGSFVALWWGTCPTASSFELDHTIGLQLSIIIYGYLPFSIAVNNQPPFN
eukprot:2827405-Amphidinium_carterae.1